MFLADPHGCRGARGLGRAGRAGVCGVSEVATRGDGIKQYLSVSRSVLTFLVFTFFLEEKCSPLPGILCFFFFMSAMEEDRVKCA